QCVCRRLEVPAVEVGMKEKGGNGVAHREQPPGRFDDLLRLRIFAANVAEVLRDDRLAHEVFGFVWEELLGAALIQDHAPLINVTEYFAERAVMSQRRGVVRRLPGDRIQAGAEAFVQGGLKLVSHRFRRAVSRGLAGERVPELKVIRAGSVNL